jgi:hypothetical protein
MLKSFAAKYFRLSGAALELYIFKVFTNFDSDQNFLE